MTLTSLVTTLLSVLTVIAQLLFLLIIIASFSSKNKLSSKLLGITSRKAILLSFIVALVATSGSLFYSEIAGYNPCKLCWFQRIMMYPQVIILAIALWKKDNSVSKYLIPLAVIGILISSYHYYIRVGGAPIASCSADSSESCAKKYTLSFGYITIPMMALTAFLLISALLVTQKRYGKIEKNIVKNGYA